MYRLKAYDLHLTSARLNLGKYRSLESDVEIQTKITPITGRTKTKIRIHSLAFHDVYSFLLKKISRFIVFLFFHKNAQFDCKFASPHSTTVSITACRLSVSD